MSVKLKREKDLITRRTNEYNNAVTEGYSKYFQGSPTFITYFQLISPESSNDNDLDAVHSLQGGNSPNKYRRIEDVAAYGSDMMSIETSFLEFGMNSESTGELYFMPNSIIPTTNDFFFFDIDGLKDHMLQVTDAQFDKGTQKKAYRISWKVYSQNSDYILENVENDYQFIYENIGGDNQSIILKSDSVRAEHGKSLYDSLIKRFIQLFYNSDMDQFTMNIVDPKTKSVKILWNPYLQRFIHKNNLVKYYNDDIMTELYISSIDEFKFKSVFSENSYNNSIYNTIETCGEISPEQSFYMFVQTDLSSLVSLPFFCDPKSALYVALKLSADSSSDWMYAHPILADLDKSVLESYMDDDFINKISDEHKFKIGYPNTHVPPEDVFKIKGNEFESISLTNKITKDADDLIFKTIYLYLNDKFVLTDEFYKELNKYNFKSDVFNFIFMPIIMYIVKQSIDSVTNN